MEAHSFARSDGGLSFPRSRKLLAAFKDERLVAQLRRGNDVAFEVLYDRHNAAVLSYCRHMLGSRDEAEDALQQAFVSAHGDIVATDKPIRFKAWIFTIARNRCLSILRARREQPSDNLERISTAGLPEEVEQRAELKELLADMQELPDDQRTALILSELGDLSHAEVAEVIDCEVAKVKSLVFQARSGLMERRQARETPCEEIREQLATLRGGSLRRGPLRRHLNACLGCSEFRDEVRRQRQMVAAVLPVVPTLGLRENAFAAVGIGASSAGSGALLGGGGAVFVAKAGIAKVAVIAIATGGAVGGAVAVEKSVLDDGDRAGAGQQASDASHAAAGADPHSLADAVKLSVAKAGFAAPGKERRKDSDGALADEGSLLKPSKKGGEGKQGFEPVQGGSNGARARDFASDRGQGQHRGLNKPHRGIEKQTASGGANGVRRGGAKPERTAPQRPENSNSGKNQAKPAPKPKPEHPLTPLVPDLTPPMAPEARTEKEPRLTEDGTADDGTADDGTAEQP
jgi:RNA polymerase sigma factor (sigma-70 family)